MSKKNKKPAEILADEAAAKAEGLAQDPSKLEPLSAEEAATLSGPDEQAHETVAESRTDEKAPESLVVTSKNVTDMRVATLAQKLALSKAEALGTVVCLALSAAEGLLPKIDRAHLETWAVHSGLGDITRGAIFDALKTSGWIVKGDKKGELKLADWKDTRQVGSDD